MKDIENKIRILSESARYDVSCSSSGSKAKNRKNGLGNTNEAGICHSWSEDGRCISLLKILMTNYCIYDCDYCINRRSNDVERAMFTVDEIVNLTMDFYKRNYIEGLFLSSGIYKNSDYTMELLLNVAKTLRLKENFNGYIHMKSIPGSSKELNKSLGLYVDRLSVNIELPSEKSLKIYAPDKKMEDIEKPMLEIRDDISANKEERKLFKKAPSFVPAGQSTQMIVGAGSDSDYVIINRAESLYNTMKLKRVYYSAFVPVKSSKLLKSVMRTPLIREHRLYQSDFLMRFYDFKASDLISKKRQNLDIELDPKAFYAIKHPEIFPVEINKASYSELLKVPGIGPLSAKRIIGARKLHTLSYDYLKSLGVVLKRAKHFILCGGKFYGIRSQNEEYLRAILKDKKEDNKQLSLFGD